MQPEHQATRRPGRRGRLGWLVLAVVALLGAGYVHAGRAGAFRLTLDELRARYASPESQYLTVEGVELHYCDEGRGPAVLLLPGSFGTLRQYDEVVARLRDRYRLVRVDIPGTGLSGAIPDDAVSRGLRVEDLLVGLLDQRQIDEVSIFGFSSGGIEAYRFAATRPGRVQALILSNTPPGVVGETGATQSPVLAALVWLSFEVMDGYRPRAYWRPFLEWVAGDPTEVTGDMVQEYYDINRRKLDRNPRLRPIPQTPGEITPLLNQVRAPTLLLWGARGPVLPPPTMAQMARELTHARVTSELLPETGHYSAGEDPELIADRIDRFLVGVGVRRAEMPQWGGGRGAASDPFLRRAPSRWAAADVDRFIRLDPGSAGTFRQQHGENSR
jgi:pimeloyl-ACP methyl ester carboxylesterase